MAYSSLDRKIHVSISFLSSSGWVSIADEAIKTISISEITASNSRLSMGEFCRNKIEFNYIADKDNPIAWQNKKIEVNMGEGDFHAPSYSLRQSTDLYPSGAKKRIGYFYVDGKEISTKDNGKTYTVVGYDTPDAMTEAFNTNVSNKVKTIVSSIESTTGMKFVSGTTFSLDKVDSVPDNTTNMAMLGYLAGYEGKNIRVNADGELELYWYDTAKDFKISRDQQYLNQLTDRQEVPGLYALSSGSGNDNVISVGTGSALSFVNPYIDETQLNKILERVKGLTYNKGTVKWRGDPSVRAGDTVLVETDEGTYVKFLVMQNSISFDGGMSFTSDCYSYESDNTVLGNKTPTERKIEETYNKLDAAFKAATELMKGGSGGYYMLLTDSTGKPYGFRITDSDPITPTTKGWMFTNNGLFYSADGFRTTSKVAITMDGHIMADAVDAGILSDGDGRKGKNWWDLTTGEFHIGNITEDSELVTQDDAKAYALKTEVEKKISTYSQSEAPTENITEGDLWIDTNNDNLLYRWDGTKWVECRDGYIDKQIDDVTQKAIDTFAHKNDLKAYVLIAGLNPADDLYPDHDLHPKETIKNYPTINETTSLISASEDKLTSIIGSQTTSVKQYIDEQDQKVTDILTAGYNSKVEQTQQQVEISIQRAERNTQVVADDLQTYKDQNETYFRFSDKGLEVGKQEDNTDSPYKIILSNEKMAFLEYGSEIAYIQYNKMHINAIEALNRMSVGAAENGGYFDFISTKYGMGIKWRAEEQVSSTSNMKLMRRIRVEYEPISDPSGVISFGGDA